MIPLSNLLKKTANAQNLTDYSDLYVKLLGTLYSNLHAHEPFYLNGIIAQPFFFGAKPDVSWIDDVTGDSITKIIYHNINESLRAVRVIRYYDTNVILIIKPDRLRYWIQSTAIRDADETLTDLQKQGWK